MTVAAPKEPTSMTICPAAGRPSLINPRMRWRATPGQWAKSGCPRSASFFQATKISTAAIYARKAGGKRGAAHAHGGTAKMAVDERPLPCPVDEIGRDEREGDGLDPLDSLKVTAKAGIQQQRQRAPVEDAKVVGAWPGNSGIDAKVWEGKGRGPDEQHEDGGESNGKIDSLRKPAVTLVEIAAAVCLRDDRIETEQDADAEKCGCVVDSVAHSDGADGFSAEAAHHDRVHDGHGDPSHFRKHNRNGQREQLAKLFPDAEVLELYQHPSTLSNGIVRGEHEYWCRRLTFGSE